MAEKVIGIILLIAGVVFLLFGFAYINSPQYKTMNMVYGVTGGSDPTGNIAIGIGAVASVIGLLLLIFSGSSKKVPSPAPTNPKPVVPEVVEPPIISVQPDPVIEEPTVSVAEEPARVSSPYRVTDANTISPHFIYAGAGLIAVIVLIGGILWLNASNRTSGSPSSSAYPVANNNVANQSIPAASSLRQLTKDVPVDAQYMWTDTGVDLQPGDYVSITASGQATAVTNTEDAAFKWVGPDGWGYQPKFNVGGKPARWLPVLGFDSSLECLTGKVGDDGSPFKVGSSYSFSASQTGRLFLGVNNAISDADGNRTWQNTERGRIWSGSGGSFEAHIDVNGARRPPPVNRQGNIPTVKQMQDDIEKEIKKMVDEANR